MPAHLIGSPNPKKGDEQAPEFLSSLRNVSTPFSSVFAGSGNSNLSVISLFLRQKGVRSRFPGRREAGSCLKESCQISRGSWAWEAPGSRPAALSRRPAPSCQPVRRVAAALRRRQRQLQQGLSAAVGHGVHGPQPLHVAVLRVEASRRVRRRGRLFSTPSRAGR